MNERDHAERLRELTETGRSVRYTGRPIMTMIREALDSTEAGPDAQPGPPRRESDLCCTLYDVQCICPPGCRCRCCPPCPKPQHNY